MDQQNNNDQEHYLVTDILFCYFFQSDNVYYQEVYTGILLMVLYFGYYAMYIIMYYLYADTESNLELKIVLIIYFGFHIIKTLVLTIILNPNKHVNSIYYAIKSCVGFMVCERIENIHRIVIQCVLIILHVALFCVINYNNYDSKMSPLNIFAVSIASTGIFLNIIVTIKMINRCTIFNVLSRCDTCLKLIHGGDHTITGLLGCEHNYHKLCHRNNNYSCPKCIP